jgi:Putative adhesin
VIALVLVAVLAVGLVLAVLGRVFRHTRVESAVYRQPVSRVVVGTGTGSIDVRPGAAGSPVTVQRTLEWSLGRASSQEAVSGDVLTVRGRCEKDVGFATCSVSYVLTVPAATAVNVTSSTGAVQVRDLSGDVQARTSTGSVDLTGLRAPAVTAETSTGSVVVRFAAPPSSVSARAGIGSVEVVLPGDGTAYDVRASTSTGRQSVRVPVDPSSTRHVTASTSTGSVEVRTPS